MQKRETVPCDLPPELLIRYADPKIKTLKHLTDYGDLYEIVFPCGQASLLWMAWRDQAQPKFEGEYHHLNFGQWVLMPRKSACYGHAYAFSHQVHPLSPTTPEIQALYDWTNKAFNLEKPLNMCLANHYDNGREYISEHSDDERQMNGTHEVYCWCTGNARTAVFRRKGSGKPQDRVILEIDIPAGLYVMAGRSFQRDYTHEFPQRHPALFKKLLKLAQAEPDFPKKVPPTEKGAVQTTLVQAAWIKSNRDRFQGRVPKEFDEWCLERTSFTLRSF